MSAGFTLAAQAQAILDTHLTTRAEFDHLGDARIVCLASASSPVLLRGNPVAAFIAQPSVQGPLSPWFEWAMQAFCAPVLGDDEPPDYVIVFDDVLWALLEPVNRDRLVYHELCHLQPKVDELGIPKTGKDGRQLLHLVPHDRELFDLELLRYGAAVCGHGDLAGVIREGDANVARAAMHVVRRGR